MHFTQKLVRFVLSGAALVVSFAAATPSAASITYTFNLGQGSGFTVVAPTFLSAEPANKFGVYNFDLNVADPYGTMIICTGFTGAACGTQSILPTGLAFSPSPTNVVVEYRAASVGTIFRYFTGTALGVDGVYRDVRLSGTDDTLSVASTVPEPTTWTAMLIGFATLGGVLRSRRREAEVAPI